MINLKQDLFTPDEAFLRVGQTRQVGCLIIVGPRQSYHLSLDRGSVVHAYAGTEQGQQVLEAALHQSDTIYAWLPDYVPAKKRMNVSIPAFALKNAVATDVQIATTGKVLFSPATESTALPVDDKLPPLYLVPKFRPAEKFYITSPTVILGRDPKCDIVIQDTQISRRHCLFQKNPKGIFFRDLDSANGVRVNGIPVKEGLLGYKDNLGLGTYVINVAETLARQHKSFVQ